MFCVQICFRPIYLSRSFYLKLPLECLLENIAVDGLGPCKKATDAHHGTLEIKLQTTGQVAVVGITASSSVNTRIRLICTDLTAVNVCTVCSSKIQICNGNKDTYKEDLKTILRT